MDSTYSFQRIPRSRIASFDTAAIGLLKHRVSALLEFDVTGSRKKLRELRRSGCNISFNAWLIKVISNILTQHREAAAFLYNRKKLIIFDDINVSVIVEKEADGSKVPIPLVIEKANKKSPSEINDEIEKAKRGRISESDIVLNRKSSLAENIYYRLPGLVRRAVWKIMLRNPRFIYKKMGNAVITSVGMIGKINGWFIHTSIHPISFGVGSVIKKPVVIDNQIKIRELLNMTILVDHDVIDGAPMVRFLNDLTLAIENDKVINSTVV
jgi:pyruvate/2-oxoglutarate dehydrogenase complex dihydrolipoamide acyltransferase (E2) component